MSEVAEDLFQRYLRRFTVMDRGERYGPGDGPVESAA
jgi:hypothetical protein